MRHKESICLVKFSNDQAERMMKDGEMPLEKIARYVPALSMDELKKLEAEVMQLIRLF